ncbi:MAG: acetate--CoA ligase [Ignavibacteriales bacterium]|jgi:acetyl-coenzyme A synthetase (EC 6.2.1.1)|nr:MAG: acetate--CoA ligase [Ignavibacteriaceae bacterium]MBW7873716.1 acetate--CoA ligase [Ignavibacteria bacterium]MCZ2143941.1 acetate--CoA ligase [Ignavibacteriales bacterium]MBV6444617.1 Acetyl-coenzyme A synthetase [Ignavibacteriaceae bacterium]MBZ0195893.1 acetate--CoA ligase [Ignavibacteriaceae bacterium]
MNEVNTNGKLEGDVYYPSQEVIEKSYTKDYDSMYKRSIEEPEKFWDEMAREYYWSKPWDKVLDDSNPPFFKWFVGGKTNIVSNAIDRHLTTYRKNKLALIWESEAGDEVRTFSYYALNREVTRFANILKGMGVKKGDIVTIYMPRIPELQFAMLACAKIGAAHSVVYGGFSVESLAERIEDARSKVLITADGGFMRGKIVNLKQIANEAIARQGTIEHVVVVKRTGHDVHMEQGRDYWYHDLLGMPIINQPCETEQMDAEDLLYVLYTSGTTGKPKGVIHTHGGYMVFISATYKYIFDINDEDRYWCAADPGWVTGHSYIVYGPLIQGATSFMYEGAPNFPYPNRWWKMIEKYGITVLYAAPTAIRGLMRFGDAWPNRHDLSSLRLLGSVGEPINPEAWKWYYEVIGRSKCPIVDTWWQTETGGIMISALPTTPLKPGSATRPFFGIQADVYDLDGKPTAPGEEGLLVVTKPWPGLMRGILHDPERYKQQYFGKFTTAYEAGDAARKDKDGYFWVIGRLDDVIKVSGYRLGTAEIESALVSHPAVSEAAAIGLPHDVKGHAIHVYVVLKEGFSETETLGEELKKHVDHEIGPIARPEKIEIMSSLPKTRSGKIMRRLLRARALGQPEGDKSTLEE